MKHQPLPLTYTHRQVHTTTPTGLPATGFPSGLGRSTLQPPHTRGLKSLRRTTAAEPLLSCLSSALLGRKVQNTPPMCPWQGNLIPTPSREFPVVPVAFKQPQQGQGWNLNETMSPFFFPAQPGVGVRGSTLRVYWGTSDRRVTVTI